MSTITQRLREIKRLADDDTTPTHELVDQIGLVALLALRELESAPAADAGHAQPVSWIAVLDDEQRPHQQNPRLHRVGFQSLRSAESWVAEQLDFKGWRYAIEPLILQRDHLATVAALQARIKDLERQKEIDIEQGNVSVAHYAGLLRQLSDAQARINALEARQLPEGSIPITRQSLAELIQDGYMAGAKRGVETAVTDLLAKGWTAPQSSQPDTSKEQP